MQKKTIKKTIESKLSEWLDTITDLKLRRELKGNIVVSGGCIASMLQNEDVNDFDIYIKDIDVCERVALYYIDLVGENPNAPRIDKLSHPGISLLNGKYREKLIRDTGGRYNASETIEFTPNDYYSISVFNLKPNQVKLLFGSTLEAGFAPVVPGDAKYYPSYFSPNAISLTDKIQIVLRFGGTVEEIHKTFDFVHATNYFTFEEGVVLNLPAMESLMSKQLKYQGSMYPLTSILRAKKFVKRYWNISAGEMLKIMFQISKLDLTNPNVLEEQLVGVDVAYFSALIAVLRSDKLDNVDENVLFKLIDKIFNESESEV